MLGAFNPYRTYPTSQSGAGSSRTFAAIRKEAGVFCGSFLRKGEELTYVGLFHNLKDLKRYPSFELFGAPPFDTTLCLVEPNLSSGTKKSSDGQAKFG